MVKAATRALEAENVDLVLPFVKADGEEEVRKAFEKAIRARKISEAREVADLYFLDTVVRVHRAGEGAPYTGLRPAGLDVGPVIPAAEEAIEIGSADELTRTLSDFLADEVKHRFDEVMALQKHAEGPVPEARRYVEAMLGLQVWSHRIYLALKAEPHEGPAAHHEG
ncbi:MAG TPA: DUF6448 family protein [Actinomycetota bacterium]